MSMGTIQMLTKALTGPVPTGIIVVAFLAAGISLVFNKKFLRVIMAITIMAMSTVILYSTILFKTHMSPPNAGILTAIIIFLDDAVIRRFWRPSKKS